MDNLDIITKKEYFNSVQSQNYSSLISQAVSVSPISQAYNGLPVVAYDDQSNIYFPKLSGSNMTTSYICPPNSSLYSYNDKPVCVLTFEDHIKQVCPTGKVTKNLKGISGNVTINSTNDTIWCDNDV